MARDSDMVQLWDQGFGIKAGPKLPAALCVTAANCCHAEKPVTAAAHFKYLPLNEYLNKLWRTIKQNFDQFKKSKHEQQNVKREKGSRPLREQLGTSRVRATGSEPWERTARDGRSNNAFSHSLRRHRPENPVSPLSSTDKEKVNLKSTETNTAETLHLHTCVWSSLCQPTGL